MTFFHGPPWRTNFHGSFKRKRKKRGSLGPSLGVNRMWIKRNDHVPKVNVLIFLNICSKGHFWKKNKKSSLIILLSSLVFIFFSQQKKSLNFYFNNISLPWTLAFILLKHLFCFSHRKTYWIMSMDYVGLKYVFWRPQSPWSLWRFFLLCKPKWSQDEFNSQWQILQGLETTSWSMV